MRPPPPLTLSPTLEAALSRGAVLRHGRLQQLDSRGHVVNDAAPVAAPWRAPLADAVRAWTSLEAEVPGVQLVSVYARGSLVRGLGLPGISDVDTLGYAVVDASSASSAQLRAWRRERAAALRAAHPVASGFDLELVAAPRGFRATRLASAVATSLSLAQLPVPRARVTVSRVGRHAPPVRDGAFASVKRAARFAPRRHVTAALASRRRLVAARPHRRLRAPRR